MRILLRQHVPVFRQSELPSASAEPRQRLNYMKQTSAFHFIPQFNASRLSFDDVVETAKQHINSLSENKQKKLKDELGNGLANLTTKEQLDMYISSYGEIHRQKLQIAYDRIPHKVWSEGSISVVDYGCGQCIAEMVLSDFLKNHYIDNDKISDFTVIEPSKASLTQGLQYLEQFYENSKITAYNVSAGKLTEDYIRPQSDTVIHLFSNVLDIIEFERHNIANILNSDMSHNHILVCVSPFYQENGRGALMDEFGNMLRSMRCEYKLEKHTDDWKNPFSCQVRIFVSAYY